jgi:MerR family transcriptional regulator, mercuric resistance operon regulatory protein
MAVTNASAGQQRPASQSHNPSTAKGPGVKRTRIMRGLTIGKLAEAAHVHIETVRYYERVGLMPPPQRTRGGHRSYHDGHARRLIFICHARRMGFTIADIRSLLSIHGRGRTSCAEVRQIAISRLESLRERLGELKRMECLLADAISPCLEKASSVCVLLDMLDGPAPDPGQMPKRQGTCDLNRQ